MQVCMQISPFLITMEVLQIYQNRKEKISSIFLDLFLVKIRSEECSLLRYSVHSILLLVRVAMHGNMILMY